MQSTVWYKSKMFYINVITLVIAFFALPTTVQVIPTKYLPYVALFNGFLNLLLRQISATPITLSEDSAKVNNAAVLKSVLLVFLIPAALISSACGQTFMQRAAIADKLAAHEVLQIRLAVDQAHKDDCDLNTPGVQPCLNDADYKKARATFDQIADAGLALGTAIRSGNAQSTKVQIGVVIKLAQDLVDQQVVKLPTTVQLIVTTSLSSIQIALAGLN